MSNEKEFGKGSIYIVINYLFCFLMGNVYFALLNIPMLILLFISSKLPHIKLSLLEIYLYSLSIGPAFTALLGVMGKLIREKDISITRDFFRMYKINFKQSLFIWGIQLAALIILYVDIKSTSYPFSILFIILFTLISLIGIYIYPIVSRFHLKTKDVVTISFIYLFMHFKATISIVLLLIINVMIFYFIPSINILFIISLICYSIMYYQRDILKTLENKTNEGINCTY